MEILYSLKMARKPRIDIGGNFYHCMNRANARLRINFEENDYLLFLEILKEAQEIFETDILAFVVMNNHFHIIIHTKIDGEMSSFFRWLTLVHTQRWHKTKDTVGTGHLYQGRYKSVLIKDQNQLSTTIRYVERNPLTANLVSNVLDWRYSSLFQRYKKENERYKVKLAEFDLVNRESYLEGLVYPLTEKEKENFKGLL